MKRVAASVWLSVVILSACNPKQFEALNRPKSPLSEAFTAAPLLFSSAVPSPSGSDATSPPNALPLEQPPMVINPALPAVGATPIPAANSRCEQVLQCAINNTPLNSRRIYYQQLLVNVTAGGQGDNTPGCPQVIATVVQEVPSCQR